MLSIRRVALKRVAQDTLQVVMVRRCITAVWRPEFKDWRICEQTHRGRVFGLVKIVPAGACLEVEAKEVMDANSREYPELLQTIQRFVKMLFVDDEDDLPVISGRTAFA